MEAWKREKEEEIKISFFFLSLLKYLVGFVGEEVGVVGDKEEGFNVGDKEEGFNVGEEEEGFNVGFIVGRSETNEDGEEVCDNEEGEKV